MGSAVLGQNGGWSWQSRSRFLEVPDQHFQIAQAKVRDASGAEVQCLSYYGEGQMKKSLPELTIEDIRAIPLWRFTNSADDDLEIEPALEAKDVDLSGLISGTQVRFSDGTDVWALLQNISRAGKAINDHFLTLTINHAGEWFTLARYHDINQEKYGPLALARFVGKPIDHVFPISFDLRSLLGEANPNLVGVVLHEPVEQLSRDELIDLSLL